MIRQAMGIFVAIVAVSFGYFLLDAGQLPEPRNALLAIGFAAMAAPAIAFYWKKQREWREQVIARAYARQLDENP
ncbi:hypothetical protein [Aurantiacibacter sp. MUD61]|uniref:hypothetical protein n=1 Tax=Aurantiacibacter sp. MUD61 TaxID=3009083 RepID=UPI0022F0F39C|nr:hypothetical protein [Aurantiacibacter sp. MUD61]